MQLFPRVSSWCGIVVLFFVVVAVSKFSILLGRCYNMEEGAMVEEKEKACFDWIMMVGLECAGREIFSRGKLVGKCRVVFVGWPAGSVSVR